MKLTAPLLSEQASGTLANILTFSNRKTGPQVRFQRKQKDAQSADQLIQRAKFNTASLSCRFYECGIAEIGILMIGIDLDQMSKKNISNYNVCIQSYLLEI